MKLTNLIALKLMKRKTEVGISDVIFPDCSQILNISFRSRDLVPGLWMQIDKWDIFSSSLKTSFE